MNIGESDLARYVSRSALKLKHFLDDHDDIVIDETTCLDVGSSTGGFVQVLIERGASKVIALDVGTSQLHDSLRDDARIHSLENTDIRDLDPSLLDQKIDVITVDVSFISLTKILPSLTRIAQKK